MTPESLFSEASKCFRRGRYTEALDSLNRLLDHNRDSKTYALLAKTLSALGFREDAARTYVLAAELGGSRSEDFYVEAMTLYYELDQDDIALSLGLPLLERAQRDPDVAFMIASLFLKRGEKDLVRVFLPVLSKSTVSKHNSLAYLLLTGAPEDVQDRETITNLLQRMPRSIILILAYLVFMREVNDYWEIERLEPELKRMYARDARQTLQIEAPFYNLHWLADEAQNKFAGYNKGAYPAQNRGSGTACPIHGAGRSALAISPRTSGRIMRL